MGRAAKFNAVVKNSMIELYAQGYDIGHISKLCNVSRQAMHYWIKKYELRELMDNARSESAKECIEVGLRKLALGSEESNSSDEFVTSRVIKLKVINEDSGEIEEVEKVIPVKRIVKKKIKPPEVKAIEVLARKYYKEFDAHSEDRELTTKILEGFTMRELQEARKDNPIDKGQYIDAKFTELNKDTSTN